MPKEQSPGKPTTRRYSPEKAATVRMVRALSAELGTDQRMVQRVARQLGYGVESVRTWVRQADIDEGLAPGVSTAFLTHLETERHNSVSTCNARLIAIHSLFRYAALRDPEHAESIQRVLAVPAKRHQQNLVCFLTGEEIDALLSAPDNRTWFGRRDQTMLTVAVQTGLRVSELTQLAGRDIHFGRRGTRLLPRQGTQGPRDPAERPNRHHSGYLVPRIRLRPNRSGVPDASRPTVEHRRGRLAAHQTRRHRGPALPVAERKAPHPARPAAHRGQATAPQRCRHLRDRALARPRKRPDHPDLPARRPGPEGKSTRPNRSTVNTARPLPPARRPARLPRSHLNMPNTQPRPPPPTCGLGPPPNR
jgi:integrase